MTTSNNRQPAKIIFWLVAWHVLLLIVAIVILGAIPDPPNNDITLLSVVLFASFMLGPSQATLLALWLFMGGGKWHRRLLFSVFGSMVSIAGLGFSHPDAAGIILGQICIATVSFSLARAAGVKLAHDADLPAGKRRFQFAIRDILILTTATAIVLSVVRTVPLKWLLFLIGPYPGMEPLAIFGSFEIVVLASLCMLFGRRRYTLSLVCLPLAVGIGALILNSTSHPPAYWHFALPLGLLAAWIAGSLNFVRMAGYRLAWEWPYGRRDTLFDMTTR